MEKVLIIIITLFGLLAICTILFVVRYGTSLCCWSEKLFKKTVHSESEKTICVTADATDNLPCKPETYNSAVCKICFDNQATVVFDPCMHLCICTQCLKNNKVSCPLCRRSIAKTFEIYIGWYRRWQIFSRTYEPHVLIDSVYAIKQ